MNPDLPVIYVIRNFLAKRIRESIEKESWVVIITIVEKEEGTAFFFSDNRQVESDSEAVQPDDDHHANSRPVHFSRFEGFIAELGGEFSAKVDPEMGLSLFFTLPDFPDNLPECLLALLQIQGDYELMIHRQSGEAKYELLRSRLVDEFGSELGISAVPRVLNEIIKHEQAIRGLE